MTNKPAKSNLERMARSKRKLRVVDLLNTSDAVGVLEQVSQLPGLQKVSVIALSDNGVEIYHNSDIRAVILQLVLMQTKLVNDYLYPENEEAIK